MRQKLYHAREARRSHGNEECHNHNEILKRTDEEST